MLIALISDGCSKDSVRNSGHAGILYIEGFDEPDYGDDNSEISLHSVISGKQCGLDGSGIETVSLGRLDSAFMNG